MNEVLFLLQFNYPRLFSSHAASVFLQGPTFEPFFFFLQVGHLEHKELYPAWCRWTSVPRRMGSEPQCQELPPLMFQTGSIASSSELKSSHLFPFFARATFLSTVLTSTAFLSTNDRDHRQQKGGISRNTICGVRLWLLHIESQNGWGQNGDYLVQPNM